MSILGGSGRVRGEGSLLRMAALGVCVALGGCVVVDRSDGCSSDGEHWEQAQAKRELSAQVEHVVGKRLLVETENGAVWVERAERADVAVDATITALNEARLEQVRLLLERRQDGALAVRVEWPGGERKGSEGATIRVRVPDAEGLEVRSSNGRVSVKGLHGAASVVTSNGAVLVEDHAGDVRVETSNGRVELRDVGGADVNTSNGAVEVVLRDDASGPVKIATSNGSVRLAVGSAFKGIVRATTSNGSVAANCPRAITKDVDRASGSVQFGSGATSTVLTSNGSVRIDER